jgi:hypothetical protein
MRNKQTVVVLGCALCTVFILLSATALRAAPPAAIVLHPNPNDRSVFLDGDLLQSDAENGLVRWVRDGRLIAELIDSEGLLSRNRRLTPRTRLYVLDAIGQQADWAHPEGELFLSATAPKRIFWQRGHNRQKGGVPTAKVLYGDLLWRNGDVLTNNTTMAIFWGPQWTNPSFAGDKISGLDQFFAGFGFSLYAGNLTEYYGSPSGTLYGASSYLGHVIDTSSSPSSPLTTSGAIAEACLITGNHPDPNALYLIYTENGAGPVSYCGWHSWGNCSNGAPLQVAYMPNIQGVAGCDPHDTWTTHSQGLAALANVSAHELSETITDPRGKGWIDAGGAENADKCNWSFHHVVTLANGFQWKLQMEWSNRAFDGWTGYPNRDGQLGCLQ